MRIGVVGLGEVGLKFAAMAANSGFEVVGVDTSADRRKLASGGLRAAGYEFDIPGLSVRSRPEPCEVQVLCVDSPVDPTTRTCDLTNLRAAAESVATSLRPGDLVIVRSTVPIGTTRNVISPLMSDFSGIGEDDFLLAFAPERTSTGMTLDESSKIRHLVGGRDALSTRRAVEILQSAGMPCVAMENSEAAELGKLASNAARDTALALATQLCKIAETHGLDIDTLIDAVNSDYPRDRIKNPRPGVGGSCLTKDSYILAESLKPTPPAETFFGLVRRINDDSQSNTIHSVDRHFASADRQSLPTRILICGAAFKGHPPTKDVRNSVSLIVAERLRGMGYSVAIFDPFVEEQTINSLGFECASVSSDAMWDAILMYSNHRYFSRAEEVRQLAGRIAPNGFIYDPYRWLTPVIDSIPSGTRYRTLSTERFLT